jgi:hypothetical protein
MPEFQLAPGAEDVALASLLLGLMEKNLEDKPGRVKDFNALNIPIGINAVDADVQITMEFCNGKLTFHKGLIEPKMVISAESATLIGLTSVNIRFGIPWFFDATGFEVVKKLLKLELRIKGLFFHPFALIRLCKAMSVA